MQIIQRRRQQTPQFRGGIGGKPDGQFTLTAPGHDGGEQSLIPGCAGETVHRHTGHSVLTVFPFDFILNLRFTPHLCLAERYTGLLLDGFFSLRPVLLFHRAKQLIQFP